MNPTESRHLSVHEFLSAGLALTARYFPDRALLAQVVERSSSGAIGFESDSAASGSETGLLLGDSACTKPSHLPITNLVHT